VIDDEIRTLVEDMAETMYAAPGCGLAAPQVGVSKRIFVIDTATEKEPSRLIVFINPEIVATDGECTWEEGCLSFPAVHEEIKRAEKVRVRALGLDGKTFEIEADGLLAVAIQHETDHLNGVLMVDHLSLLKRKMVQRKMQKRSGSTDQASLLALRLAHLSDLHLRGADGVPLSRVINKRITGYANLKLRRTSAHRGELVAGLFARLQAASFDHLVITGDLTNLSLEDEFAAARALLEEHLGFDPSRVSIIPGNHDVYTQGSASKKRFARYFEPYLASDLPNIETDHPSGPFPYVKLRDGVAIVGLSSAVPRAPLFSSGKLGDAQLQALDRLLGHPEVQSRSLVLLIHHPPYELASPLDSLLRGLDDAAQLQSVVGHDRLALALHGHQHTRVHRSLRWGRGGLDVYGATSASLHHDHPGRTSGANEYEIDHRGLRSARALVLRRPDQPLVEQPL
jgi:peptide deformylase